MKPTEGGAVKLPVSVTDGDEARNEVRAEAFCLALLIVSRLRGEYDGLPKHEQQELQDKTISYYYRSLSKFCDSPAEAFEDSVAWHLPTTTTQEGE